MADAQPAVEAAAAVEIEALHCQREGRTVLQIDALRIAAGERVAIVGANGAGKSTLLRCIAGQMAPASGQLRVLGQDWQALPGAAARRALRLQIGQVAQGLQLVGRLSAQDNVLGGLLGRRRGWRTWLRWPDAADTAEAERWLQLVGLAGRGDERADRLSGGERQKVAIARLLMQRPQLILADEPTASLDPSAAREACGWLVDSLPGRTCLTVVHTPALLGALADRVIGLRGGRLAFDRPVAEVDAALLGALYDGPASGCSEGPADGAGAPALDRAVGRETTRAAADPVGLAGLPLNPT